MVFFDRDYITDGEDEKRQGIALHEMPQYVMEIVLGKQKSALPGDIEVGLGKLIHFRLYDDDGELYYEGRLHDDEDCVNQSAALRFGEADAGCTTIKVLRNGEWKQEIG